jgi:HemY protein
VADGYVAGRWAPVSPVTGRLDAFEWRPPEERVADVIDSDHPAVAGTPRELAPPEKPAEAVMPETPARAEPSPSLPIETDGPAGTPAEARPAAMEDAARRDGALPAEDMPPSRPPDDPGPDDPAMDRGEEREAAPRRFRLF